MDLEDRLPDLLHDAAQDTIVPISAAAVIARAHRRRARTLLAASAAVLTLAAGAALAAYPRATPATATKPSPITPSPVRTVGLYQRVDIEEGVQMWLAENDVCTESQPGLASFPGEQDYLKQDASLSQCLPGLIPLIPRPGVHAQPGFNGVGTVNSGPPVPVFGVYIGATPAGIVIAGPGFTAVATLVTSPQMPGEVGYYALLPAAGGFSPVTEIAYDAAGHVLATTHRTLRELR